MELVRLYEENIFYFCHISGPARTKFPTWSLGLSFGEASASFSLVDEVGEVLTKVLIKD